jgi:hypothetical protein
MKKQSRLLEKISLGMGITGFVAGLGFSINGLSIDKPESYLKLEEIKSKIWHVEEAKGNLQEVDTYFCSENFENELKDLYSKKSFLKNMSEYQSWEKRSERNGKLYFWSLLLGVGGISTSVMKYSKRREREEAEKIK